MSKRKLTDTQWLLLGYMLNSSDLCYASDSDRTLKALASRGLVKFQRARKYGKDHWYIIDKLKVIELLSERLTP